MIVVRRLLAAEWHTFRQVRLDALLDSPDAFLRTHAEESAQDERQWRERAQALAESNASAAIIAWDGATPVGMAGGWLGSPERVSVWGVWVAPTHRGRETARQLIAAVETWAGTSTEAQELVSDVVDGNERAAALYRRLGYEPNGVHRPLRADSDVIEWEMVKPIARSPLPGEPEQPVP